MKSTARRYMILLGVALASAYSLPESGVVSVAEARIGRPATPVSYAGVARRTTVRAVTPGAGAPGVGVAPAPGVGAPGVGATPAPGVGAPGAGAIGTVVYALPSVPSGCVPTLVGGIEYQRCESTWYQVQKTGSSVQYVIVAPP